MREKEDAARDLKDRGDRSEAGREDGGARGAALQLGDDHLQSLAGGIGIGRVDVALFRPVLVVLLHGGSVERKEADKAGTWKVGCRYVAEL